MRPQRIAAKRAALTAALFACGGDPDYLDTEGKPARTRYTLRNPKLKPIAELTVADHGVCLECGGWSRFGGRCIRCGKTDAAKRVSLADHRGPILNTAAKQLGIDLKAIV